MWYLCSNHEQTEIIESSSTPKMLSNGGLWTYRSCGYPTKYELIKGQAVLDMPCVVCNKLIHAHFSEPVKSQMIKKNMCFSCNLWDERSRDIKDNTVIANGHWYTIGDEDSKNSFRGFGGSKFQFLKDGKLITSTNVWSGGDIPLIWRDKIPDNSILIN